MGYKLDIGCGKFPQPGCIGIDYEDFGQPIIRDMTKGLPFSDNTCSEVYMNHSLEHFRTGEELFFLTSEIWRVLQDGGLFKVRVPHSETPVAHGVSHMSYWNEEILAYLDRTHNPYAAIPAKYKWDFSIVHWHKGPGIEFQFECRANKPKALVNPESAKISVILVCHNQIAHTKKAIASMVRFAANPIQLIVVDNASDDGTAEWLDTQKELTVIHTTENLGWVGGVNMGIRVVDASSDFIIFANNDITVDGPAWDRRLLLHFRDENVGAVGPVSNYVAGRQSKIFNHPGVTSEATNMLIGFFFCVRKSVVDEIGLLDDLHSYQYEGSVVSGGDDLDYSIRIREAGFRLVIARDVFVFHAGSQSLKKALTEGEYKNLCRDADCAVRDKWGDEKYDELFESPITVYHGIPSRTEYLHQDFAMSLLPLVKPFRWIGGNINRAHITIARNKFVECARKSNADYLFMTDSDHELPPDTFMRLYNMDVPVAGALAFQRLPPYGPCIYHWVIHPETGQIAVLPLDEGFIKAGVRGVDAIGFSAILIKMDVFDKILEPWFEWNDLGEDIGFCLKCADAKIPIFCDTDLILPHIGENTKVTEEQYLAQRREEGALIRG